MEMAKVTSKGQITIPVSIRKRLDIKEGDKLLFIDSPDGVVMVNPDVYPTGQETEKQSAGTRPASPASPASPVRPAAPPAPAPSAPAAEPMLKENPAPPASREEAPARPPATTLARTNPDSRVKGLDVGALLDEIRSIGSKV